MKAVLALCFLLPALAASLSRRGGPDHRVVGGSNANIANHPYQASLRHTSNNGEVNHVCGAVLTSATRAITSAHCGGAAVSSYSLLAGTTERTVQTCATCALRSPILQFNRHAEFANNPGAGYPNDIASLWFYSIASNANIRYAELAQESDGDFHGESCVVSGWGRLAASGQYPTTLQAASMTVLTNAQCVNTWSISRIRDEHICAVEPDVTVCGGDQGGPLVCNGKLAGMFSWGEASCGPQYPAVFSRISYFYSWIIEQGKEFDPAASQDLEETTFDMEELMGSLFA